MQVAREHFSLLKQVKWRTLSNAWAIYLRIGDNIAKAMLIPDDILKALVLRIKGGLYK